MKTKIAMIVLTLILAACSKEDANNKAAASTSADNAATTSSSEDAVKPDVATTESTKPVEATANTTPKLLDELDWVAMPELKDIGNFPFLIAPEGFKIENEKDGFSEFFKFEKFENYTGTGIYTTEGKLGVLVFSNADGSSDFQQRYFDKSIEDYFKTIGAKFIYKGKYPSDEAMRQKLGENMFNGKSRTVGLASDEPFSVYAFKNNGLNYIVNIQSNTAAAYIYMMELKAFEQTIKAYSAAGMKADINTSGKAILNINFDTDKATLKPDGAKIVDEILVLLNENPALKLSIEGHTDNVGAAEHNKKLSADRANTVMYALAGKGIDIGRLKSAGVGADKPLVANDTDDNKAKNRRVELVKF